MSINLALATLVSNRQRITHVEAIVHNHLGHHTLKVWFGDQEYSVATTRNQFEAKVYKSLSGSLSDITKLGIKEFKVTVNVI